jgi:Ca2+-binding EF-hand superfamily protein
MLRSIPLALSLFAFLMHAAAVPADDAPQPEDVFRTLDANGDGILSAGEIGEPQRRAFERLLRVGDADADGRLTREEYLKAFQPDPPAGVDPPGGGRAFGRDAQPQRPDLGRLFDLADRDGDGKIALADLPELARERVQPLFERLGKQQLTREDFERIGRMQRAAPGLPPAGDGRLFARFDRNGDGRLTREEIPEPLRRRFDTVYARLDKDELTPDDFAQALRQQRPSTQDDRRPGLQMQPDEATRPEGAGVPLLMLGRLLDADGDQQLTTAEIDSLNDHFTALDADGDGKLSGAELRAFADRLTSGGGTRPAVRPDAENPRPRRPADTPPGA